MASKAPASLASWRLESAVEPFFSGGAVASLPDGRALTACGDEVKVRIGIYGLDGGRRCLWTSRDELANGLFFDFSYLSSSHPKLTNAPDRQRQHGSCGVHARRGEEDLRRERENRGKRGFEKIGFSEPPLPHVDRRFRHSRSSSTSTCLKNSTTTTTTTLGLRARHGDRRGALRHTRLRRVALPGPACVEADDDHDGR